MAREVSSSTRRGRPLRSASARERVSSHRRTHRVTASSSQRSSCAMSRPVQPTPCRVTMAARSTRESWSMQPLGRPNMESGEEGSGEGDGGSDACRALSSCALWQSLHSWPCFLLTGFHMLQVLQRNCTRVKLPHDTRQHRTQPQQRVREGPLAHTWRI